MTIFIILIIIVGIVTILIITISKIEQYIKKNKSKMSFKESIDLTDLPIITFKNNGIKLNFVIDTGSSNSHINNTIMDKIIYTKTDREMSLYGITGESSTVKVCIIQLFYKDIEFEGTFSIGNFNAAFTQTKKDTGVTIHGILGTDFLQKYKYVLDFKNLIIYKK